MLLHYGTLGPTGESHIAAIRFSGQVRIRAITVFENGSKPFAQQSELTALTRPDAFFLNINLNALPVALSSLDSKQKQKGANALIPTKLAYAGGTSTFDVDMGENWASRLMVLSGEFESISIAVYGDLIMDGDDSSLQYSIPAQDITVPDETALPSVVDVATSADSTELARELAGLIPKSPPLPLMVRLMFTLKALNEDWETPEFPHIYANLTDTEDMTPGKAFESTLRPIYDGTSDADIEDFVDAVSSSLPTAPDIDETKYLAGLLRNAASQPSKFTRSILEALNLRTWIQYAMDDEEALQRILDAASNPEVSQFLDNPDLLPHIQRVALSKDTRSLEAGLAVRLLERIHGWSRLDELRSTPLTDDCNHSYLIPWIRDIAEEEKSFGIWLYCMMTHDELVHLLDWNRLTESVTFDRPPTLLQSLALSVDYSSTEAIILLRAFLGVAAVVSVFSWSDSLPNEESRAHVLSILRLWQETPGYCEILEYTFLLRQMTYRLDCNINNEPEDPPTGASIEAERMLEKLARLPESYLREEFTKDVLNLQEPLAFLTADKRHEMQKLADQAEGELVTAIETVSRWQEFYPRISDESIRALRIALSFLQQDIFDQQYDASSLAQTAWRDGSVSIIDAIIDDLWLIAEDLSKQTSSTAECFVGLTRMTEEMQLTADMLDILERVLHHHELLSRPTRSLTDSVVTLLSILPTLRHFFRLRNQLMDASSKVESHSRRIFERLSSFSDSQPFDASRTASSLKLFRSLFAVAHDPRERNLDLLTDAIMSLMTLCLPSKESASWWLSEVAVHMLQDLKHFISRLPAQPAASLVHQFIEMDVNGLCIGETLIESRICGMKEYLLASTDAFQHSICIWGISSEFNFLLALMKGMPSCSQLVVNVLCEEHIADLVHRGFLILHTSVGREMASLLVGHADKMPLQIRLAVLAGLFSGSRPDWENIITLLPSVPHPHTDPDLNSRELGSRIGRSMFSLAQTAIDCKPAYDACSSAITLLRWFSEKTPSELPILLPYVSNSMLDNLRTIFLETVPEMSKDIREIFQHFSADTTAQTPEALSDSTFEFNIESIENSLVTHAPHAPHAPTPSTPPLVPMSPSQDVLGMATVSPSTALFRSPSVTGLTKIYTQNEFRDLRTNSLTRQNTSRLPSRHVDEFAAAGSPPPFELHSPIAGNASPMLAGIPDPYVMS